MAQRVWIDCELFDWEGRVSELKADMFGDEAVFEVDYVRVWKRGTGGKHHQAEQGANLVTNGNFATNLDGWKTQGAGCHSGCFQMEVLERQQSFPGPQRNANRCGRYRSSELK